LKVSGRIYAVSEGKGRYGVCLDEEKEEKRWFNSFERRPEWLAKDIFVDIEFEENKKDNTTYNNIINIEKIERQVSDKPSKAEGERNKRAALIQAVEFMKFRKMDEMDLKTAMDNIEEVSDRFKKWLEK